MYTAIAWVSNTRGYIILSVSQRVRERRKKNMEKSRCSVCHLFENLNGLFLKKRAGITLERFAVSFPLLFLFIFFSPLFF